ncbi:sulfotransferase domain-containing protein [Desulfovibrio sulfodismutans]|uniref:Sulfotransferase domain-containing protein n=1 Tax=Desulfolutivibrio sulfodismutans TaxID=63561 RepID=A0A7K3NIY1_9BACT|nr:sulfotransferase domain-containing protein [Desulfolutivibrio sulfodismutans]NDY56120.1 sulfotransferase domain-containing protein [Desulfolutivibrio sulfodismutans]
MPHVIGLGLEYGAGDLETGSAFVLGSVLKRCGGNLQRMMPEDFVTIFSFWLAQRPGAKVAAVPFGLFAREYHKLASTGSSVDFYDRAACGPAKSYRDVDFSQYDAIVITSVTYQNELRLHLLSEGVPDHKIITCLSMFESEFFVQADASLRAIAGHVRRLQARGRRVAAYTHHCSSHEMVRNLASHSVKFDLFIDPVNIDPLLQRPVHPVNLPKMAEQPDDILVCSQPHFYREAYRDLYLLTKTGSDIILPYHRVSSVPSVSCSDGTPALLYLPEFAGVHRFEPTFNALAQTLNRINIHFREPIHNPVLQHAFANRNGQLPPRARSEYLVGHCMALYHYEFTRVHFLFDLSAVAALNWIRVLVLLRDPRDMLNSRNFWLLKNYCPESYKQLALDALQEPDADNPPMCAWQTGAFLQLLSNYRTASRSENMRFIRYEDIRAVPKSAYLDGLKWLAWNPDPFSALSDEQLEKAIYLGTFEYQTLGKRKPGDGHPDQMPSAGQSCRKGVRGDWRSRWDDEIKDRFKEVAGDLLIELGYETDDNW